MNCTPNDHGGITYASSQRFGAPENRHELLSELRMAIDSVIELGQAVRAHWPQGVEMPHELQARIQFNSYVVERLRGGALSTFARLIES